MSKRRAGTPPVHTITSAAQPLGDDISRRARRYLVQMTVRTLCFLGAVFTWGRVPTWLSVSLLVGAVVLPYVAVVLANAGRERPDRAEDFSPALRLGGVPTAPGAGPGARPGAHASGAYAEASPFEPSTFPVVDPFGPGVDPSPTDPSPTDPSLTDLPVTEPPVSDGPATDRRTGRTGRDGAGGSGRRSG